MVVGPWHQSHLEWITISGLTEVEKWALTSIVVSIIFNEENQSLVNLGWVSYSQDMSLNVMKTVVNIVI